MGKENIKSLDILKESAIELKKINKYLKGIGFKYSKDRFHSKCLYGKCFLTIYSFDTQVAFSISIFIERSANDNFCDRMQLAQRFVIYNVEELKFLIERNTRLQLI